MENEKFKVYLPIGKFDFLYEKWDIVDVIVNG